MQIDPLIQPNGNSVGDRLISELESGNWSELQAAVAFAKMSGVAYLDGPFRKFVSAGGKATVSVGIDHAGTSFEALSQLLGALGPPNEIYIAKHVGQPPSTFHPKVYVFLARDGDGNIERALVIAGSSNFTEGGLFSNYELSTAWTPDLTVKEEVQALDAVLDALEAWRDVSSGIATPVDVNALIEFHTRGWLPTEKQIAGVRKVVSSGPTITKRTPRPPGKLSKQKTPPKPSHSSQCGAPAVVLPSVPTVRRTVIARRPSGQKHQAFFIDITAPSDKTEVYLSKTALAEDPGFFGHPFTGLTTPKKAQSVPQPERSPRPIVDIRLLDQNGNPISEYRSHSLKIWQYDRGPSANQDVRITIPQELLRSLPTGCILEMRRVAGRSGIEYRLDFLTPGSQAWNNARAAASIPLPGGKRQYGWA